MPRKKEVCLDGKKTCTKCRKTKYLEDFCDDATGLYGKDQTCRSCRSIYRKELRKTKLPFVRREESRHYLEKAYNLSLEEYDKISESQGNVCKVCGNIDFGGYRLSVDHDHVTGKVRGLLCGACNRAIGQAKEDPALLMKLATYLLENS